MAVLPEVVVADEARSPWPAIHDSDGDKRRWARFFRIVITMRHVIFLREFSGSKSLPAWDASVPPGWRTGFGESLAVQAAANQSGMKTHGEHGGRGMCHRALTVNGIPC